MRYVAALLSVFVGVCIALPQSVHADDGFEVSAWIPYWKAEAGVNSVVPYIGSFTEVNPFMYTVREDGSLNEADALSDPEWQRLYQVSRQQGVRFVPTVMWSGADAMHAVLSDPVKRAAHVKAISAQVYRYNLDGVDIDYEAKYAKTREYFSTFIRELESAIGYDKWVMCTVESRTPLDSRYSSPEKIPSDIEYSNDFAVLGAYCDRVRIMAYDQGRIDVKLNEASPHPYIPVADTAWVRKVMELALKEIPAQKLELGIPTYGYEYDMFVGTSGKTEYSRLWSFNPRYPDDTIAKLGLTIQRVGGEAVITYPASQSLDPVIPLPNATRVMVWSDAKAVEEKIALARELGLRGVSIFKIDGGQDHAVLPLVARQGAVHGTTAPTAATPRADADGSVGAGAVLPVPARNLKTGSTGAEVRQLQQWLNAHGFMVASSGPGSVGNETEKFGALTRAAVVAFQKRYGITPSVGYFGPLTRAKMQAL